MHRTVQNILVQFFKMLFNIIFIILEQITYYTKKPGIFMGTSRSLF